MRVSHIGSRSKAAVAANSVVLDLPFPPSANNLFPTGANGGRYRSKEYDAWRTLAGWELKQQRPCCITGPVEIAISFKERSRNCDLDNRIKPVLDLLVHHGIIDGDDSKTVKKITAKWGGDSRAHIEIIHADKDWIQRRNLEKPSTTKGGHPE